MQKQNLRIRIQALIVCLALIAIPCIQAASSVGAAAPAAPTGLAAALGLSADDLLPQGGSYEPNPVNITESGNFSINSTSRPDVHGTFSIENFSGTQANLSNTHESAAGFRNYLATWHQPNFNYQDTNVGVWSYHDVSGGDNLDLWSSGGIDYGIDAVLACWHSGHGGMNASGTFSVPMGSNWGGRGWNATSTNMRLGGNNYSYGDERLRYMFWDTCQSLETTGGQSPLTSWGARVKGIRMIFGYDTNSIDSSRYGQYLWEEWNKGKSLSQAFLDASWRINTHQSPSVVACGANSTEATDRLNNERFLAWGSVSSNWMQWRWYWPASPSIGRAPETLNIPAQVGAYQVSMKGNSESQVRELAGMMGIDLSGQSVIESRPFGLKAVRMKGLTLVVEQDGDFELSIQKAPADAGKGSEVSDEALLERAQGIVDEFNLAGGSQYRVGTIRYLNENGGGSGDSKEAAPKVVERTVILDQVVDGMAFIDPDAGHMEISFDSASGQVKNIRGTLRAITASDEKQVSRLSLEEARQAALQSSSEMPAPDPTGKGAADSPLQIVAGSEFVGYYMLDGKAVPVYTALITNSKSEFNRPFQAVIPLVK